MKIALLLLFALPPVAAANTFLDLSWTASNLPYEQALSIDLSTLSPFDAYGFWYTDGPSDSGDLIHLTSEGLLVWNVDETVTFEFPQGYGFGELLAIAGQELTPDGVFEIEGANVSEVQLGAPDFPLDFTPQSTTVPEPHTSWLAALGLILTGLHWWRVRR